MSGEKRCALMAAILGSGIVFLDGTIVNVALPAIRQSLSGGLAVQQWVVEAYLLTLASLLLVGGSLGDILGRRRVFQAGLVGFGVCSLACALAPSAPVLIAARAIQGIAGALLVPSTLALIMDTFDKDEQPKAIGSWTAWTGIATVIGPLGGGAIVQEISWRWIFAVNLIPVLATLYLLSKLPADKPSPGRVDLTGAVLCTLGLAGPVFALIEQPNHGWHSVLVLIPLIAGLTLFASFIITERRSDHPMMPLALFRVRNFAVGNLTTLALYAGLNVAVFFVIVFEQQVAGFTPIAAGLSLLPITLVMFTLSRRAGALAAKFGPHRFMAAGPILAGCGLLLLTRVSAHVDYLTQILPGVLVFALGLAATVAPLTSTVLGAVAPGHSGVASGINNAVARVAGLLAIAALGAVVASSFQARLTTDLQHSQISHTLLVSARQRPLVVDAKAAPQLREAQRDASVHAVRTGLRIGALLAILGGIASLIGIKDPRRPTRNSVGPAHAGR